MSIDLNAGIVERMVQQNQYHICAKICNNSRIFYDYYESFILRFIHKFLVW